MIAAVYARVLLLATLGLLACATSASAFAAVLEGYGVYEDGTRDRVNVGGRCSPQSGRLVCHFISVSSSKRPDRCSLLVSEWSETLTRVSSAQADEEHWAATKGPEGLWGALATTTLTVKRILGGSTRMISELTQRTGGGSLSPSVMHLKAALGLRAPADCRPDEFTVLPEDR